MNTKWQVTPEVLSSKIDDEAILMSIEMESYFGLNPVGSRIWELLSEQAASAEELAVVLMKEYEVDEITCRKDVQHFINEMSAKKLIRTVAGSV